MSYIRKYQSFSSKKRTTENAKPVKESAMIVNDMYKVNVTVDIPQSLINAYVKKVKDNTGKNLRQFFGDMDIAEEIVKYLAQTGLDADKLSPTALVGGGQQQSQAQPQAQPQAETQSQPQAKVQVQTQSEPQSQTQGETQTQGEIETQAQGQGEFEEVQEEGQGEEEEEEEGGEELPE